MQELLELIQSNGISVVCVAYLIYFQSTTMKSMLETLTNISNRLSIIETKIDSKGSENQ